MPELNMDGLSAIAEAAAPGGLFDRMDDALRQSGKSTLADHILKLQQDAGEAMNRIFFPEDYEPGSFAPGPESAALRESYEPVTTERLAYLGIAASLVQDQGLRDEIRTFTAKLLPPTGFSSFSAPKVVGT